ncbi:hypothetical protein [Listeria booriae]|uniref:Uncharacterized protein n=1 Tax=Listeria booriae TaxID=1552123 RepID=A0A841XV39_9LIST|nr:hypothetical protein [Listeria booriae]MBC1316636.1 hypothetical protein [Listeria booriae]
MNAVEYEKYKKKLEVALDSLVELYDSEADNKDYGKKQHEYESLHDYIFDSIRSIKGSLWEISILKDEQ